MLKFLLVMGFLIGSVFAGVTVPTWSVSQDSFRSGSSGIVTMTVSNTGEYRMSTLGMTIINPPELAITGPSTIVDLGAGGSTSVSLPFRVKDNANSGIYLIEVRFSGFEEVPGGQEISISSIAIPVVVVDSPELTLTTDTQLIGGIDPVVLTIDNKGGIAKNIRIKIDETSDVALFGTNEIFVEEISDLMDLNMILDSRDAEDGPVDLPILVSFENELGITHQETEHIRITVRKERLDITFLQQSEIITRNEDLLTLEIVNNGAELLEDVRITFEDPNMRLKNSNEIKVGDIESGKTATASSTVFADYSPGLNLVPATITWVEENVEKTQLVNIPLTISSDAEVGVYLEAKPAPLIVGGEHTISVLVSNLGSHPIDNVQVGMESEVLQMLDISTERYLGSLETDDFSTVQFKVRVNASSAGSYPMNISVSYRDKSGEWVNDEIRTNVDVQMPISGEGPGIVTYLIILAVIGVIIWYFKFRRKG